VQKVFFLLLRRKLGVKRFVSVVRPANNVTSERKVNAAIILTPENCVKARKDFLKAEPQCW